MLMMVKNNGKVFGKKMKIRTFGLRPKVLSFGKEKEKAIFFFFKKQKPVSLCYTKKLRG